MTHCDIIRHFSSLVYSFLTDVFKYRLNFSELGLSDHMLHCLIRHSHSHSLNNIKIYKSHWGIESKYGNDIDLFVQTSTGNYNWYALQGKVMSFNGAYEDLIIRSSGNQQWDMLLSHETLFGSKTFYLLYNGKSHRFPLAAPKRSDCLGIPTIDELGLGIVETSIIKHIRTTLLSRYGKLYFKDVFPDHIDPIRKLLCCFNNLPVTTRQYLKEEINTIGYTQLYFVDDESNNEIELPEDEAEQILLPDGHAPVRIIIETLTS